MQALQRRGFNDLVCVQNKTVVTNAFKGEDLNHYVPIFKQLRHSGALQLQATRTCSGCRYEPKARMRVLNRIFPEGIHIPDYFFGRTSSICRRRSATSTRRRPGAMKNAFGGLLNTRRHYTHSWIHETLVDLLAIQKEIHPGVFAVMDGTTAGNGPGPRTMYPVVKNVMLASADQVAIDAVAAKMMGFDPMTIDYIRLAHEDGLGVGDPREIEIVGDTEAANESWKLHRGQQLVASAGGDLIWFGPLKPLQKLFFHTPLVNGFIAGERRLPRLLPLAAASTAAPSSSGAPPHRGAGCSCATPRWGRWAGRRCPAPRPTGPTPPGSSRARASARAEPRGTLQCARGPTPARS